MTGRSVEVQLRRAQALNMRRAGKTYDEIAAELDYTSRGSASKDVSRALDQVIQEAGDQLITLERERLGGLIAILWPLAEKGDVRAARECLRVLERTHRLMGLDKTITERERDQMSAASEAPKSILGSLWDHLQAMNVDPSPEDYDHSTTEK